MNKKKFKFFVKHTIIVFIIIIIEVLALQSIVNMNILIEQFSVVVYFLLVLPLVLLYLVILFLSKLFFSKFKLRQASKFQTRLMIFFIIVSVIPIIPLTFVSNEMLNRSLKLLLTKNIDNSLKISLGFVNDYLNDKIQEIKHKTKTISFNPDIIDMTYSKILNKNKFYRICKTHNVDFVFLYSTDRKIIGEYQPKVLLRKFFINKKFLKTVNGKICYSVNKEIYKNNNIDYIEIFQPIYMNNKVIGVLIVGKFLPKDFSKNANMIAATLQSYKQIELYKKPIVKGITTFIVIIITLLVLFISIIVSYYISKGITEPIRILLEGTKEIAAGNLDFKINYKSHDEIKLLINAFNQMTKEIKSNRQALMHTQRLAAWRDIARRIAHEIKNPLTPIKLNAERLLRKQNDPGFHEILKKSVTSIITEVNRLQNLINEFSNFARMPQLNLEIENLNFIITEVLTVFSGVNNIKINTNLEKNIPLLNLDKKRIKEVLINLINNSLDALKDSENGVITIKTYTKSSMFGNLVYLEVIDNGPGISQDIIDKLFEPYVTTRKDGTGLGLSIVEKIITEHNAKIKCENVTTGGTKFIIEFTN